MKYNKNVLMKQLWGKTNSAFTQPVWGTPSLDITAKNVAAGRCKNLAIPNIGYDDQECEDDPLFTNRNIRRDGTDIYFGDSIDDETQLILQRMLKQCAGQFMVAHIKELLSQTLDDSITIHLDSPGGYAYCGLALYDFIKSLSASVPISCVIEGCCASAATLIFLACEERSMSDNSVFLMHQCSWGAWGDDRYMQDEAENSRKLMARLRKIYMAETDICKDITDDAEREDAIQKILSHDKFFYKEECIKLGIIKDDIDKDHPLSEESLNKLNEYAQKLFEEEQKAKKAEEDKKTPAKKATKKTTKKATKKSKKVDDDSKGDTEESKAE